MPMSRLSYRCLLLAWVAATAGCGQRLPDWMVPPPVDPRALTKAVMAQADADKNGLLDAAELATIPALRDVASVLDTSGDQQLSNDEISTWFERVKKEGVPHREAFLVIMDRGKPLANALVRIVPEACMGGTIEPAEGRTDNEGRTMLMIPTSRVQGVRSGLYRLEITGKRAKGKPIPPQYNTETTLGFSVSVLPWPRQEINLE